MSETQYDIVIFGASSFVGQILVGYMAETFGCDADPSWAIAGRSEQKLERIQQQAKDRASDGAGPEMLIADSGDPESLRKMCARARVVVSTVGPYALYGENLIKACIDTGTDYCDLTGETQWLLQMISKYQPAAADSGARIVNCCGFDSIPSDLGVYFTHIQAEKHFGRTCNEISMRVAELRGTFSGGTFASMVNAVEEISKAPALRKALVNPYCLCPSNHPFTARQVKHSGAEYDDLSESWIAPFVMENINTRVVHRSNALFDNEYGEDFKYDEAVMTGKGRKGRKRASRSSLGLRALMIGAAVAPARWLLERFFLPKPGEGPSPEQQLKGRYTLLFFGKVSGKGCLRCSVSGDRDPGYGSTAKILGQAAVCLAKEIPKGDPGGGFWTPARIFSDKIIPRLEAHSGLTFKVDEVSPNG